MIEKKIPSLLSFSSRRKYDISGVNAKFYTGYQQTCTTRLRAPVTASNHRTTGRARAWHVISASFWCESNRLRFVSHNLEMTETLPDSSNMKESSYFESKYSISSPLSPSSELLWECFWLRKQMLLPSWSAYVRSGVKVWDWRADTTSGEREFRSERSRIQVFFHLIDFF